MLHGVEGHPQKKYIVDALLNGRPVRAIAATLDPPLHFMAIQRYKKAIVRPAVKKAVIAAKLAGDPHPLGKTLETNDNHAIPEHVASVALQAATEAIQTAPIVQPYLARIKKHQETIDRAIAAADDGRTIAALVGTDLKGIELDARLTGALDTRPQTQDVNLSVMVQIPRAVVPEQPRQLAPTDVEFTE